MYSCIDNAAEDTSSIPAFDIIKPDWNRIQGIKNVKDYCSGWNQGYSDIVVDELD